MRGARTVAAGLVALALAAGLATPAPAGGQTIPGVPAPVPLPAAAFAAPPPAGSSHLPCGDWGAYGRDLARTFDAECPSAISPSTVASLVPMWTFKTPATVTASPAVVDGRLFVGDWSATMFALDAATGAELWRFAAQAAPGAPFGPIVASPAVATTAAGRQLVVFGSGPTMHALDAATGEEVWGTYVGSAAAPEAHPPTEETEFESSPVIWDGVVYSGLDVHNRTVEENFGVRGGILAFDLATGVVLGRFDPEHDFLAAGTGERLSGCSGVWSSPTLHVDAGLLYFATANCPTDLPPDTGWGRHIEAISAIDLDPATWADPVAATRWTFTPEPLNRDDTDFGATPNLYLDAGGRTILGVGKKDAVYYALDPLTGQLLWSTKVTEPGNVGEDFAVGGFIGTTATGRGRVFGATALGFAPPYYHALDGATGAVLWSGPVPVPSYAASAHVNGVVLSGALDGVLKAYDAADGDLLWSSPLLGPISSGPAVVEDRVYVGSGTSSSDLCAKDAPGSELCFLAFDETLGATGGVHAFTLTAPGHRAAVGGTGTRGILLANEGNRTYAFDLDTLERRLISRAASDEVTGAAVATSTAGSEPFRDVNGQVCFDPTDPRRYIAGEDTGQPAIAPGWGAFQLDGDTLATLRTTQVGRLAPAFLGEPDTYGCAFLPDGRLLTATIGDRFPGQPANGQLLLWFPPFDDPDGSGAPYCTVDETLATAGGLLVDDDERVYVAANRPDGMGTPGGILRYTGALPTSPEGCTATDRTGAPAVPAGSLRREVFVESGPAALTPSAIAASGRGTFFVSSVISGTIAEVDAQGDLLRFVLTPTGVPGLATGTPYGLAVDADGTLYYADLGVLGVEPAAANGTVRRIRFDGSGLPLAPETLNAGLDYPDGLGVVTAAATPGGPFTIPLPGPGEAATATPGAGARTGGQLPATGPDVPSGALPVAVVALVAGLAGRRLVQRATVWRRSGPTPT